MRIILFFSIVFSCFEFVGCTPMSSEKVTGYDEKKIDSSLIQLAQKIREADTILLVSHTGVIADENNHRVIHPEILIGDKINQKIIQERKVITGSGIDTLVEILLIPKPEIDSLATKCEFDPNHAIFIINQKKVSYIDLWFVCCGVSTSDDLKNISPFGEIKWKRQLVFFKKQGFRYELPETIFPKLW